MDLSYLSPSFQKNPFLEGNSKIKKFNDGKTLTGEKETTKQQQNYADSFVVSSVMIQLCVNVS
jgi:hypothetical protein